MYTQNGSGNPAEKARLRDAIAREVARYLERGGSIDVVETPAPQSDSFRGSAWHGGEDLDALID
jgi:hypothetical protein